MERKYPILYDQVIFTGAEYNFGGPFRNESYVGFLHASKIDAKSTWEKWLAGSQLIESTTKILKLILMTKNECSTLEHWIAYHGKMLGFHNLYILDGSSEERCINLLITARDQWQTNVIFTKSNLNTIRRDFKLILETVRTSCDMVMKFDTDEFLAVHTNAKCHADDAKLPNDCRITPYGVANYLNSPEFKLTGERKIAGFTIGTIPDRKDCDRLGGLRLNAVQNGRLKAILDTRTAMRIDLGGHVGYFYPPFHNRTVYGKNRLAIIHAHARCVEIELKNCRTVLQGHGLLKPNDTDAEVWEKIKNYYFGESDPCNATNIHEVNFFRNAPSKKKAYLLARFLKCPAKFEKGFFPPESKGAYNSDFQNFLQIASEEFFNYAKNDITNKNLHNERRAKGKAKKKKE